MERVNRDGEGPFLTTRPLHHAKISSHAKRNDETTDFIGFTSSIENFPIQVKISCGLEGILSLLSGLLPWKLSVAGFFGVTCSLSRWISIDFRKGMA